MSAVANGNRAGRLAPLPADLVASVGVVAQGEAPQGGMEARSLPADVTASVVALQTAAQGGMEARSLPADVTASVVALQTAAQGGMEARSLPADVTASVVALQTAAQGGMEARSLPADVTASVVALETAAQGGMEARSLPADVAASVVALETAALWAKEADYADEPAPPGGAVETTALDNSTIYRIVRVVAQSHTGDHLYGACESDPDLGLLYGLVLFPQASPLLGEALRLMKARDASAFASVFGPAADELLVVTGAPDPARRLAPVGGEPLTSEAWRARFHAAGEVPAFWAAQNEVIIERQFRPMLGTVLNLGITTERSLAMAYDAVISRGLARGLDWLRTVLADANDTTAPAVLVAASSGAARTRLERLRDADL